MFMKFPGGYWLARVFLSAAFVVPSSGQPAPPQRDGWTLVWSDEFNGSSIDRSKWVFETGAGIWGNEELEYYTDRPANLFLRNGNLVIRALVEKHAAAGRTWNFTSARIKAFGKFSQKYGRFEARIKVPGGQGMWSAFWMLGDDIAEVGWPACGEIDVMENIGREPSTVHGSIHGPGFTGKIGIAAAYTLPDNRRFADDFHVFAVEWGPDAVNFYVDDHGYASRTPADLKPGWKWVFDKPFFLILNLAVGGDWPGNPDATTNFPGEMLVDYVRVYRAVTTSKAAAHH